MHMSFPRLSVVRPLLALAFVCCLNGTASADGFPLITVNEAGQGTLNFGWGPISLPAQLLPDPGPGGLPSVLTYNLLGPPALIAGDVLLQDGIAGPIFDVVRFNPTGTGGNTNYPASVLFYSDNVPTFDSLGDTFAPPGAVYPNVVTLIESGPDGNNGGSYTPLPGQPGFVPGFAVSYNLQSDVSVSEPGMLALLGCGLFGFVVMLRRRRLWA